MFGLNSNRIHLICVGLTLAWASSLFAQSAQNDVTRKGQRRTRQGFETVLDKSAGCLVCHTKIEKMHQSEVVKLGCTDCHGGNARARTLEKAHVKPRFPDKWRSSGNPVRSYLLLNKEDPDFIRFVNPGDLRVAEQTCGTCHAQEVLKVRKSMMTTNSLLWGGAAYNNGVVSNKVYNFGESYDRDGKPQRVNTIPAPRAAEMRDKGILPYIVPLPRWEISQVGNIFRTFERGGKVSRINPSNIGSPLPFEEPGKPDMKLGDRGLGTQLRISTPVLNIHKTRLNDPSLSFLGTNDHPGDYRSSGCTACHVVYANDRSPDHAGPYARFGNQGRSQTADQSISKREKGHPLKHRLTLSIPSSQCMVCHMHQVNAFVNTYYGFQMWDYETDGKSMYPKQQQALSDDETFRRLDKNPEEAVLRGKWGDDVFLANVSKLNPKLKKTQFSDYHGHGWIFRAVFKKDRKGHLLDKDGTIIPENAEHKFHGVVPVEGQNHICDQNCLTSQKAVHLKDIHLEKGMHCVDCHFEQDVHGTGKLHGEFHNAIEIQCVDCHGTVAKYATLATSGVAAPAGGTDLSRLKTPFGDARFERVGNKRIQRSMLVDTLSWDISQVRASVDPASQKYNPKSYAAKLIAQGGGLWDSSMDPTKQAHSYQKMECQSCHTSWVTNCFGCHLPQQANWKKNMNHFEGTLTRNWTTYNPQVVRDDGFMLCLNATTRGSKITTARSSSALILSSRNANREQVYLQQPPISAPGFSSQAFNPHFAHTVRKVETRTCTDCHVSAENDNNAWMAQVLLQGTNFVNFIGKYAYVAEGKSGFEAVQVTESDEPQAVIGSYLQKLAYPDDYRKHVQGRRELKTAFGHDGDLIRSLQLRGEYLYTANGRDGFQVFDLANIDNKGFSQRIVSAPVSGWGQKTRVKTRFATAVALPTTMPVDTRRKAAVQNRANQEQRLHPLYSYAYVTDKVEGLILVDVMTLADGDPRNNFLQRALTFNPRGLLNGAVNLAVAGSHVYVLCRKGLVVVDIDKPLKPKIVATISAPDLRRPRAIAIQFRYAFVCDETGVKVLDITEPDKPMIVTDSFVPLQQARDIYVARTYAYVAAGKQGLAIIDIEKPGSIFIDQLFTAEGRLNDVYGVKVAATNASSFAYVADGRNGLRVVQLTSPLTPGHLGFSPRPTPLLIASYKTNGPALAISKGLDRDRAVDESGNQVSVFGRLGSRPFNMNEQRRFYIDTKGKPYVVSDDYWKQFVKPEDLSVLP